MEKVVGFDPCSNSDDSHYHIWAIPIPRRVWKEGEEIRRIGQPRRGEKVNESFRTSQHIVWNLGWIANLYQYVWDLWKLLIQSEVWLQWHQARRAHASTSQLLLVFILKTFLSHGPSVHPLYCCSHSHNILSEKHADGSFEAYHHDHIHCYSECHKSPGDRFNFCSILIGLLDSRNAEGSTCLNTDVEHRTRRREEIIDLG